MFANMFGEPFAGHFWEHYFPINSAASMCELRISANMVAIMFANMLGQLFVTHFYVHYIFVSIKLRPRVN